VDDMTGAPATGPAIGPRRLVLAWVLAIVGQAALTALLRVLDPHLTGTALHAMLYLSRRGRPGRGSLAGRGRGGPGRPPAQLLLHPPAAHPERRLGHRPADLRVYVGGLRKKLEDDPCAPRHLITEPGMSYRFEA
jgi:hypothetical protein